MRLSDIFNILLIIGAVQGFIFIFVTFTLRRKIEKPVIFLNLFVLFLSLNNLQSWILERQDLVNGDSTFSLTTFPWYILIVPMFYSFLIHYLEIEKKKSPLIVLSIILFFGALVLRFIIIRGVDNGRIALKILKNYHLIEDVFALGYSLVLFVVSIHILMKQKSLYQEILNYDNLKWVQLFLGLGGFVFLFWLLAVLFNVFSTLIQPPYSYYPLRLFSSILIYWVAYQSFLKYRLLKDRIKLRRVIGEKLKDNKAKFNQGEAFSRQGRFPFEKFESYVIGNKSYLNPNVSLELVASELKVGTSTLSKVINSQNTTFSDYINQLRVTEAKKILLDKDFDNYTIVAIGMECGFNSKSTFYSAFKKLTSKTPSEFKAVNQ